MARHHDKMIDAARDLVASTGRAIPDVGRMSGDEIDSYLKGFGLNAHQVAMIRTRWQEDGARAYGDGYDEGADSVRNDPDYYT